MTVILAAEELRSYLKLSDSTISRLASRGDLPGFKMGNSWQFDLDEILELIDEIKKRGDRCELPQVEERI
jgi:excisionase family DNA binding protein